MQRTTVKELLEMVKRDYDINGLRSKRSVLVHISHLCQFFEAMQAEDVKLGNLQDYILTRRRESASNATINRELSTLKRGYTLGADIVSRCPKITKLKENNVREGFVEIGEFEQVRRLLPVNYSRLYAFAFYYGWRKSEILSLPRNAFDEQTNQVRLDGANSKNGEGRTIVVAGDGLRMVVEAAALCDSLQSQWLFCEKDGTSIARSTFDTKFKIACGIAGHPERLFHDLRRSATRNFDRAGVPRTVGMKISGHKTESQHERYNITSGSDTVVAAGKIDQYVQQLAVDRDKAQNDVGPTRQQDALSRSQSLENKALLGLRGLFESILGIKKEENDV